MYRDSMVDHLRQGVGKRCPSDGYHRTGHDRPHEGDCLPEKEDLNLMTRLGEGVGVMEGKRRLRRIR